MSTNNPDPTMAQQMNTDQPDPNITQQLHTLTAEIQRLAASFESSQTTVLSLLHFVTEVVTMNPQLTSLPSYRNVAASVGSLHSSYPSAASSTPAPSTAPSNVGAHTIPEYAVYLDIPIEKASNGRPIPAINLRAPDGAKVVVNKINTHIQQVEATDGKFQTLFQPADIKHIDLIDSKRPDINRWKLRMDSPLLVDKLFYLRFAFGKATNWWINEILTPEQERHRHSMEPAKKLLLSHKEQGRPISVWFRVGELHACMDNTKRGKQRITHMVESVDAAKTLLRDAGYLSDEPSPGQPPAPAPAPAPAPRHTHMATPADTRPAPGPSAPAQDLPQPVGGGSVNTVTGSKPISNDNHTTTHPNNVAAPMNLDMLAGSKRTVSASMEKSTPDPLRPRQSEVSPTRSRNSVSAKQ